MNFKKLFDDDRAVSPVIGVILMVAITVILAAVIGTFVLGLGNQVQTTTPNVNFGFDFSNPGTGTDTLDITHETGAELTASQLTFVVSGATDADLSDNANTNGEYSWSDLGGSGTSVSAGSSVTVDDTTLTTSDANADNLDLTGATVRVTWTSDSGDTSATLAKWSGPSA